jgi:hypothetical protein
MNTVTAPTFTAGIYVAGDLNMAREVCRRHCMAGLCVTVEPVEFYLHRRLGNRRARGLDQLPALSRRACRNPSQGAGACRAADRSALPVVGVRRHARRNGVALLSTGGRMTQSSEASPLGAELGSSSAQSQPSADAGTHIPRSPEAPLSGGGSANYCAPVRAPDPARFLPQVRNAAGPAGRGQAMSEAQVVTLWGRRGARGDAVYDPRHPWALPGPRLPSRWTSTRTATITRRTSGPSRWSATSRSTCGRTAASPFVWSRPSGSTGDPPSSPIG